MSSARQAENNLSLSSNEIYELLSNPRRRQAIHIMKRDDRAVDLSTLAEEVAAWENDKPVDEVTSDERHLAYSSIQQNHIPQMERAGVITHERGKLELTDAAESLDIYMDVVPGDSIPWGEYYFGLSAFSLALVAAVGVGVFPEWIPELAWAAVIGVLFAISAAYHVYQSREMLLGSSERPPNFRS